MVAVDHHEYAAWSNRWTVWGVCEAYKANTKHYDAFRKNGIEVWIGEWSLATDTCAHWLGGFNDANSNPRHCKAVECPKSYLPEDEFDTSFDRNSSEHLGPMFQGDISWVGIKSGQCWDDSDWFSGRQVGKIAQCTMDTFNDHSDSYFMWTARNEIEDKWSFINAFDKGWIDYQPSEGI